MRLGIQLLDTSSTVNSLRPITQQTIRQGETATILFQLIDMDQGGIRYVPSSAATMFVEIPRFTQAVPTVVNVRVQADYSVRKYASFAFPSDDRSMISMPLSTTETANMMSTGLRCTVTDGPIVKIAYLSLALIVYPSEVPSS